MRKSETRTIDGIEFTTTQFGAIRASVLLGQIVKLAGPAIGSLAPMLSDGLSGLGERDVGDLAPALSALGEALDDATITRLLTGVLAGTVAINYGVSPTVKHDLSGGASAIDSCFEGKLLTMFKAAAFALEVNFGDFFAGAAQSAPAAATP